MAKWGQIYPEKGILSLPVKNPRSRFYAFSWIAQKMQKRQKAYPQVAFILFHNI